MPNLIGKIKSDGTLRGIISNATPSLKGYLSNATLRGIPVELRIDETVLQWKYEDSDTWTDLIDLNDLDYEKFENIPQINDVILTGNKTSEDLNLASRNEGITSITRNGTIFTVTRPDGTTFTFDQQDNDTTYEEATESNSGLMSSEDKTKLDNIQLGSQANIIESISINGVAQTINQKNVDIAVPLVDDTLTNVGQAADAKATGDALDSMVNNIQRVADSIPTNVSELNNDSNYTNKNYVDTELAKKQDTLPFATPTSEDIGKALMPKTISDGKVTEWEFGEAGMVDDVQINGTSIVQDKTANIPIANAGHFGVTRLDPFYGIYNNGGYATIQMANATSIKEGTNRYTPITSVGEHMATFYGLAKIAGHDEKDSELPAGTYSDEAKTAIQSMLGVPSVDDIPEVPVKDVQIDMISVVNNNGIAYFSTASLSDIKTGTATNRMMTPSMTEATVFYGLSKVAGVDLKSKTHAFRTYPEEAKTAIKTMLGVEDPIDVQIDGTSIVDNGVANIPKASSNALGVVKIGYTTSGLKIDQDGTIKTYPAENSDVKGGTRTDRPIDPAHQHMSTFYGLAKAAGDSTQSQSSNAVGTYTNEAKTAIQSMLGIDSAIADAVGQITSFEFQVVNELPATGTKGVIYLVPHAHDTDDIYDEYIWITDKYERLGTLDVNLSNYVTFDDYATANKPGVVKVVSTNGIYVDSNGVLSPTNPTDLSLKLGNNTKYAVNTARQHIATFYGLAKASGDTTQSESSNPVGTYTDEAKTAIKTMLGVPNVDATLTISGSPADAKVTGDAIAAIQSDVGAITTASSEDVGKILSIKTVTNGKVTEWDTTNINLSVGTVATLLTNQDATADITGNLDNMKLNLGLPRGLTGTTPNITIGTVTTGQPGTPTTVTITGTTENPVFNFTIPKGDGGVSAIDSNSDGNVVISTPANYYDGLVNIQNEIELLEETLPTEETGQLLLDEEFAQTAFLDSVLNTIGYQFNNLPQDENLQDIVDEMKSRNALLDQLYREISSTV